MNNATAEKIFIFVKEYMQEHGYAPTVEEIKNGVGLRSKSTVHNHLQRLISAGYLETDAVPGSARALRLGPLALGTTK